MYPFLKNLFEGITLLITITFDIYSRNMDTLLLVPRTLHVVAILIKDIVIFAQVRYFNSQSHNLDLFLAAHACSKYDSLTGVTKQEFETPFTLPHTIGGWIPVSMKLGFV